MANIFAVFVELLSLGVSSAEASQPDVRIVSFRYDREVCNL